MPNCMWKTHKPGPCEARYGRPKSELNSPKKTELNFGRSTPLAGYSRAQSVSKKTHGHNLNTP